MARKIYDRVEGIKEVYVLLLNRIGAPIDSPQTAAAQILLERERKINEDAKKTEEFIERELSTKTDFAWS